VRDIVGGVELLELGRHAEVDAIDRGGLGVALGVALSIACRRCWLQAGMAAAAAAFAVKGDAAEKWRMSLAVVE